MTQALTRSGPLVVSLLARSLDDFARALDGGAADGADVVELRLDHVAAELLRRPRGLEWILERAARPTIAAIHGAEGFGTFEGGARERCEVLRGAATAGVDFVDIDERFLAELGDLPARRIVSTHAALPETDHLERTARRLDALARPGLDVVKVVPTTDDVRAAMGVLDWLATRPAGTTTAFVSGEAAAFTRLLAPAYGSMHVYAAPNVPSGDEGGAALQPAAPGQFSVAHVRAVWPSSAPARHTRVAAVVGRPIGHSAGPYVHGAACRATGVDALLVAIPLEALDHAPFFAAASRERWCGLSVTAPFKLDALAAADDCDGTTRALGAANTLTREPLLFARNTDAPAVRVALEAAGARLAGAEALVLGAGGASRAAVQALVDGGARVTVAARRAGAARELLAIGASAALALADLPSIGDAPDVIVHTTPLGTDGVGEVPIQDGLLRGAYVLDAVYRPRSTHLLQRCERAGGTPISGSSWFLEQAWLQHRRLFRDGYLERFGSAELPGEVEREAREAMGVALERWLDPRRTP